MQGRGNLLYEMSIQLNHLVFFFYKIMRECSVKRGEIISRQTKSTKLSGFQFT